MEMMHKCQTWIIFSVLSVGFIYFSFSLYYAARRMTVDDSWNKRPAKLSLHLWKEDPAMQKIQRRTKQLMDTLSSGITIITAYFDIGDLNKGGVFGHYTPDRYKQWMSVFGRINNPLIVFSDSEDVLQIFRNLRKHFPSNRTKHFLVERESMWAFKLAPDIRRVFSQPGYPEHDPNTVHENYSCVMHSKFELVNRVITQELYDSTHLAWLDIGLYRAVVHEKHVFSVTLPPRFHQDKVAYSQQSIFDPTLTPYQIVANNLVWVGGAMFIGRPEIMYLYTQDYMNAVKKLLKMNIMSTDQQVIYIMYQPSFNFQPQVELQTYTTNSKDDWFYLGYLIKDAWDISIRSTEPIVRFLFGFIN